MGPVTLLESFSPYGSRKVTVEYDGLVTAAYLHDDTAAISATWIANHRPAPPGHRPGAAGRGARAADARRADQASGRTAAAAGRRAGGAVVRGGRRGRDPGERTTARGDGRLVRHGPGPARLQRGRDRPDAVRLVAGRRHGGARAPAGAVPGLLAVAAVRVESVPAGAARAPAGPARAGRALLGRLGGQAAAGGGHRTAACGPARRTRCCPRWA